MTVNNSRSNCNIVTLAEGDYHILTAKMIGRSFSLVAVTLLFSVICVAGSCKSGWVPNPVNGSTSCYKFVTGKKASWSEASGLCMDMGGMLATLDTLEEIIWIRGYRSYHTALRDSYVWVGGHYTDNKWVWKGKLGDSPILVTDWAQGEPSTPTGPDAQHCLALFGAQTGLNSHSQWFKFDDGTCAYKAYFICEMS